MTHRASCRLPKKPSALILLAIDDLTKAERTEGYRIDMGDWHAGTGGTEAPPTYDPETCTVTEPEPEGECAVCLAGSVMAFSLNVPRTTSIGPWEFPSEVTAALEAVNQFREGQVIDGLETMGISNSKIAKAADAFGFEDMGGGYFAGSVQICPYSARNSAKFKKQMRAMAKKLAKIGL